MKNNTFEFWKLNISCIPKRCRTWSISTLCLTCTYNWRFLCQDLLERHLLDPMHCEKNICENILNTILGMHDSPGSRQDAQDMHIREEIWLQPTGHREDEFYMPHAPYVLSPVERKKFVDIITKIWTPSNDCWMENCSTWRHTITMSSCNRYEFDEPYLKITMNRMSCVEEGTCNTMCSTYIYSLQDHE